MRGFDGDVGQELYQSVARVHNMIKLVILLVEKFIAC